MAPTNDDVLRLYDPDRPLGAVGSVSGHALQPFSRAGMEAADNLLRKAKRALAAGDDQRAQRFVDRALSLPYDEHEHTRPALFSAHMALFNVVMDALERCPEDDSTWLDAALDVLARLEGTARDDLREVLAVVDTDYAIKRAESHRLQAAIRGIPERTALIERDDLPPETLPTVVLALLRAVLAYENRLAADDLTRE
ncbi:hypothetical protein [Luteipulveratus halotolerans]|uniref:Uncharacterized protein n=1 Tax=Luteipulveratus halotolerans TaxID=1631356 RepID=A0A0L6CJX0_9MICO|nr:hypothetical protein [Luteipulveratus halotolerans]KNX37915.1 hypothetical protein VV01_13340 [Luteipulveratus halotolerans]